ncbi:MAG: hypothetical protein K6U87_12480 [Firmicutes bacterium]|nr:hypothetical protein [Bacillota bacterium]
MIRLYLVCIQWASEGEKAQPTEAVMDRLGRAVRLQPGVYLLASYQALPEVLETVGESLDGEDRLFVAPIHEYGAKRLAGPIKSLIDAAWHPDRI